MHDPKRQPILATDLVLRFRCVGPECEDTCCAGWAIDVDSATRKKYESKNDLSHAFDVTPQGNFMRRDAGGMCVKNREGWCNIVEKYGDDYLSETCYFFPRSLRRVGEQHLMAATLSCPEITRMVLQGEGTFERQEFMSPGRWKILADVLPESVAQGDALAIHALVQASLKDVSLSPVQHARRLVALAIALDEMETPGWASLARVHLHMPPSPPMPMALAEAMQLLHGFARLAIADHFQYQKRIYSTLRDMEMALETRLHWKEARLEYSPATSDIAWQNIRQAWVATYAPALAPVLHRWLAAQVARNVYPFAGLGENPREQALELALGYATLQLALMCACYRKGAVPDDGELRRIVQSVARVLESLVDIQSFYHAYDMPLTSSHLLNLIAE